MASSPNRARAQRRTKLVDPRLQLRLAAVFFGLCVLALLLQFLLIARNLGELAARLPSGGEHLALELPGVLWRTFAISFGVMLPLTLTVGVLVTFRYAGPLYRIRQYLAQVARGDDLGPCRIREGDELQDLCELVNDALEAARHAREADLPPHASALSRRAG